MIHRHKICAIFLFLLMSTTLCSCRYAVNRAADFRDVFQLGAGVTAENPMTGMWPPSLGIHVQATEFLNLGASHFNGLVAEWDGRGFFAGYEDRTRIGFLPMQLLHYYQDYANGYENYFKKSDTKWTDRMNSYSMRWAEAPAKELDYIFWSDRMHQGAPIFYRGWQYWENVAVEVGICEPFITHLGVHFRVGVDLSEVFDFVLGFACVDFKQDDLKYPEFDEMARMACPSTDRKPASDAARYQKRPPADDAPSDQRRPPVDDTIPEPTR